MNLATPPGVKRIDVESAADMLNAVMKNIDGVDIFVATAAVADYRPANPVECKIKKTSESMDLKMERTVDILATVAARAPRGRSWWASQPRPIPWNNTRARNSSRRIST